MPQVETWSRLPQAIRDHLAERMRDRKISLDDLNRLRLWIDSKPEVPGKAPGLRISDRSSFAEKADIPKPFCWPDKPPRAVSFRSRREQANYA